MRSQIVRMTKCEMRLFKFALFETTRLYAFNGGDISGPEGTNRTVPGCRVIVLPFIDDPKTFPGHEDGSRIEWKLNDFCKPPREEFCTDWGFVKSIEYVRSGWPCAEYTIARTCGTIANTEDPAVQELDRARDDFGGWPVNVSTFTKMMSEDIPPSARVVFTRSGDREAVRFNFFKYAPSHSRHPSNSVRTRH